MGVGLIPCWAGSARIALHPVASGSAQQKRTFGASVATEDLTYKLHAVQEVFSLD